MKFLLLAVISSSQQWWNCWNNDIIMAFIFFPLFSFPPWSLHIFHASTNLKHWQYQITTFSLFSMKFCTTAPNNQINDLRNTQIIWLNKTYYEKLNYLDNGSVTMNARKPTFLFSHREFAFLFGLPNLGYKSFYPTQHAQKIGLSGLILVLIFPFLIVFLAL